MYTKVIKCVKEISKEEAKLLISEARIFPRNSDKNKSDCPVELDVYSSDKGKMLYNMFTLPIDETFRDKTEEELLEYARENIPPSITFC